VNTFIGMAVDSVTRKPILGTVLGGLSGPAIKPLALAKTWEVVQSVDIPVIGMGGITHARDAVEFILVGSTAVQVGTALFANPSLPEACVKELESHLRRSDLSSIADLIGALEVPPGRGVIRAGRRAS
jgi:dihydroorotate dehydrogenase (NAD+) catalytic subunit